MRISLKDKTTKEILAFSLLPFGMSTIYGIMATALNLSRPLIESTTQAAIFDGANYTTLLNGIFFMLTAFGAIGLLLQAIPMFFYKFDEKAQEGKLKAFREEKERREIEELNMLAANQEVLTDE